MRRGLWSHVRVLRVYLDQNKWIDLSRAANGHPLGHRFREALDVARAAAAAGHASFPLDSSRYIETAKRRDQRSRVELVQVMAGLSRFHTVAPASVVLPAEIDLALQRLTGRPDSPRVARVFGEGAGHAMGGGLRTDGWLDLPEGLPVPPGYRSEVEGALKPVMEQMLLLGPVEGMTMPAAYHAAKEAMVQDEEYAREENALGDRLVKHGFSKKGKLDRVILATELRDILRPLVQALLRARIDPEVFLAALDSDALTAFVRDLPSRAVTMDLRRDKHAQGQQGWEANDLNDIVGLPIAAVYCDVVITEKQWTNRMRRARVHQRYNTVLLHDLTELTAVLISASRG